MIRRLNARRRNVEYTMSTMSSTIRQTVTVRCGGVVEIHSPELHEGDQADVTVVVTRSPNGKTQDPQPAGWRQYAGAVNRKDAQGPEKSWARRAIQHHRVSFPPAVRLLW